MSDVTIMDLLGISRPLIQSPMAGVQNSELTLAVCKAGALGSLPCAFLSADALEKELDRLSKATDQPYNLNFFCHSPQSVGQKEHSTWVKALLPFYAEWGIEKSAENPGSAREPFNLEMLDILKTYKPAVVSFHFGLPSEDLLDALKATDIKIMSSATTVEEAVWLEARGIDIVIAQGVEAGGHRGMFLTDDITTQMSTLSLFTRLKDSISLPVIAAGGIGDAQSVKAFMDMGAAGVQIGTAFLLCHEARTTPIHRAALQSPASTHTALTNLFTGRPARSIVNRLMRDLGPMSDLPTSFPTAANALATLRKKAEEAGVSDFTPLWSGQRADAASEVSAAQRIDELTTLL